MGFILDGLDTESYDRSYSDRELLKRILAYFKPHSAKMLGVAGLILLDSVAGTATPILISGVIDILQVQPDTQWLVSRRLRYNKRTLNNQNSYWQP